VRSKRGKFKEYGGPQATSCEDANFTMIKLSPGASHQSPCLLHLKLYLEYNSIVHYVYRVCIAP
jgi:hypothetical protein